MKTLITTFLTILTASINLWSQTCIPADITTDFTLEKENSPYTTCGTTTISNNSILTVEAGVELILDDQVLVESGHLEFIGTEEDNVILEHGGDRLFFERVIDIRTAGDVVIKMDHVSLANDIVLELSSNGDYNDSLFINQSNLTDLNINQFRNISYVLIESSQITNCDVRGVEFVGCEIFNSEIFWSKEFLNNHVENTKVYAGTNAIIENNEFVNQSGIKNTSEDSITIRNNNFNNLSVAISIGTINLNNVTIEGNEFCDVETSIYFERFTEQTDISCNTWCSIREDIQFSFNGTLFSMASDNAKIPFLFDDPEAICSGTNSYVCLPTTISEDLVLLKENGPYVVCQQTIVEESASLILKPGVELYLNDTLIIDGNFSGIGNENDSIYITKYSDINPLLVVSTNDTIFFEYIKIDSTNLNLSRDAIISIKQSEIESLQSINYNNSYNSNDPDFKYKHYLFEETDLTNSSLKGKFSFDGGEIVNCHITGEFDLLGVEISGSSLFSDVLNETYSTVCGSYVKTSEIRALSISGTFFYKSAIHAYEISQCILENNDYAVIGSKNKNDISMSFNNPKVQNCSFINCNKAIVTSVHDYDTEEVEISINNNSFVDNETAINMYTGGQASVKIKGNYFCDNERAVYVDSGADGYEGASENCWCNGLSQVTMDIHYFVSSGDYELIDPEYPWTNFPVSTDCNQGFNTENVSCSIFSPWYDTLSNSNSSNRISGYAYIDVNGTLLQDGIAILYSSDQDQITPVAYDTVVNGEYVFEDIEIGTYTILVLPNDHNYRPTFFANRDKIENAHLFSLEGEIRELDIVLLPSGLSSQSENSYSIESDNSFDLFVSYDGLYPIIIYDQETNNYLGWSLLTSNSGDLDGTVVLDQTASMRFEIPINGLETVELCLSSEEIFVPNTIRISEECDPVGLLSDELNLTFSVTPNPVTNEIILEMDRADYLIINSAGVVIKEGYLESNIIDVSSLSAGNYIIRLITEEGVGSSIFIKD